MGAVCRGQGLAGAGGLHADRLVCCLSVNEFTVIRKKFKCPYCSFSAMHQCILKRHMRSHTGERPYPCEICGKKFTRREHMKRHTLVSARGGSWAGSGAGSGVGLGQVLGGVRVPHGFGQGTLWGAEVCGKVMWGARVTGDTPP